ncbi:ABC transporter ATP-binding protein [Nodosilinea nodulosa]|uniref:ABC transporter ATP-binding protein n=1 Tax=Nodosilinea nodulosa TaxID=416001 RepID=UPI0002E39B55|nr:ABC transporter ATP-binding protein [Nodosilinea nodulosa]
MALIEFDRVSKAYGSGELTVQALRPISLTIRAGEYCAIVGPSGSGKSTAMAILGCLDRPTSGTYRLDGNPVDTMGANALAEVRNRTLGFVFQQFHLLPQLTAMENVMLPMVYANLPKAKRRSRASRALEKVGLGNRIHNRPNQLSGGQQQRVAIARAIVNRPQLLLADEPTGALDSHTSQSIMAIFADLNREGMTVIMVTHDRQVAEQCDRIITFHDGQVIKDSRAPGSLTR